MQFKIAFCNRCRGMRVGWNQRYVFHFLWCRPWRRNSSRLAALAVLTAALFILVPEPGGSVVSGSQLAQPIQKNSLQPIVVPAGPAVRSTVLSAVRSMDAFLEQNEIRASDRRRLAESIVTSALKHDLSPRLIASMVIVESRGNAFAISGQDAVGIMQIHLPTWGQTAEREGINLFKIEDNIDFGARILKTYVRQFGLWQGVKRYNGFIADNPASVQSAEEYVSKVQRVYEFQPATSEASINSSHQGL
jgi:soluble lytic murein transglycosylase-like protein